MMPDLVDDCEARPIEGAHGSQCVDQASCRKAGLEHLQAA